MLALLAMFKGLSLWWRVGIVVGIVLIFVAAIYAVYHSIWKTGYTAAEDKYKPQILKLQTDLATRTKELDQAIHINAVFKTTLDELSNKLRTQNLEVDRLQARALEAQKEARDAIARVTANQKRYSAEIARLQAIVNGPPMTEGDSEEADSILRSILRDRMSNNPRAAGDAGRGATEDRAGEDPGDTTVREQKRFAGRTAAYVLGFEEGEQSPGGGSGGARLASAR